MREKLLHRYAVAADEERALRLERRCKGRDAGREVPRAAALDLDRHEPASHLHDEIHLAARALARCAPTADSVSRPQNSRSARASSNDSPLVAVISAVFITCNLGLDPRLRAASPANFCRPHTSPAPARRSR